jgi:hypothetical protein
MKESSSIRSVLLKRAVRKDQLMKESCSTRSALLKRAVQTYQLMKESCLIRSALLKRAVQTYQLLWKELFKQFSSYQKNVWTVLSFTWAELLSGSWCTPSHQNSVLTSGMEFYTWKFIIKLELVNDKTIKTRFRWDRFFDPTSREGSRSEIFEKNQSWKK